MAALTELESGSLELIPFTKDNLPKISLARKTFA